MDAKAVIIRLCELQAEVSRHIDAGASDCFCQSSGFWKSEGYGGTFEQGYRNDGIALEFIELAVREKIERSHNQTKGEQS